MTVWGSAVQGRRCRLLETGQAIAHLRAKTTNQTLRVSSTVSLISSMALPRCFTSILKTHVTYTRSCFVLFNVSQWSLVKTITITVYLPFHAENFTYKYSSAHVNSAKLNRFVLVCAELESYFLIYKNVLNQL